MVNVRNILSFFFILLFYFIVSLFTYLFPSVLSHLGQHNDVFSDIFAFNMFFLCFMSVLIIYWCVLIYFHQLPSILSQPFFIFFNYFLYLLVLVYILPFMSFCLPQCFFNYCVAIYYYLLCFSHCSFSFLCFAIVFFINL